MDAAKKNLTELKEVINQAKERQKAAANECKRLEKEMDDFKNNKDSKLKEIKVIHLVVHFLIGGTLIVDRRISRVRRKSLGRRRYK